MTAQAETAGVDPASGVVHAYDFGFRADGLASSAEANTRALQAACDAAGQVHGRVVLPAGAAVIGNPGIELPGQITISGAGRYSTILYLADGSDCHMLYNHVAADATDGNGMHITIRDLCLHGNGKGQTGQWDGIHLTTNPINQLAAGDVAFDASHVIERVYVRATSGDGIYVDGRSDTVVSHTKVSFAGRNGFRIRFDSHLQHCVAEKPSRAGFSVWGSNLKASGCKSYLAGHDAKSVNGQDPVPDSGHGFEIVGPIAEGTLVGCDAQQCAGSGFHLAAGVRGWTIVGCTVGDSSFRTGSLPASSAFPAFNLDGVTNNIIVGSHTYTTAAAVPTLRLTGGTDYNDVTVTNTPWPGTTPPPTPILSADSVLRTNRVIGDGAPLHPAGRLTPQPVPAGRYIFPGGGHSPGTSSSLGVGTLRVFPWYLPTDTTISRIGAEITAAGAAGSKFRVVIYQDSPGFLPGDLVLDAGTIRGDLAGVQEIAVNKRLPAGVYWVGGVVQAAASTTQPTVRTFLPTGFAPQLFTTPAPGNGTVGYGHHSPVTDTVPAVFTPNGLVGAVPRIHVKAS